MVTAARAEYMRGWRAASVEQRKEWRRRYTAANAAKIRDYQQGYYAANREKLRAQSREAARAKRAEDPIAASERERAYRLANPEAIKARWKSWYAKNAVRLAQKAKDNHLQVNEWARLRRAANLEVEREKGRNHQASRKAKGRAFRVLPRDWARMLARYDHRCAYCGERKRLTQEHVIPLKRGGRHSIGNLIPACQSCNSSKGKRLLIEWRVVINAKGWDELKLAVDRASRRRT